MGFEGANGSTGAPGMTDESLAAHGTGTVTPDAKISTTRAKFGSASLFLTRDLSGKSVVTFPSSADWDLGSGPFTLECFFSPNAVVAGSGVQNIFLGPNSNYALYYNGLDLTFRCTNGSTPITLVDTVNRADGASWYYVCVDFDGTKYRLYDNLNGALGAPLTTAEMVASQTGAITISSSATAISFGTFSATVANNTFNGWVDEFRLTKGIARYASNSGYIIPTEPFSRSGLDPISSVLAVTEASDRVLFLVDNSGYLTDDDLRFGWRFFRKRL